MASVMTFMPLGSVVVRMSRSAVESGWGAVWIALWMDDNVVNLFIYTIFAIVGCRGSGMLK
jgi:hypothetical protein